MVLTIRDFDGSGRYAWAFAAKRIPRIWPLFAYALLCWVLGLPGRQLTPAIAGDARRPS